MSNNRIVMVQSEPQNGDPIGPARPARSDDILVDANGNTIASGSVGGGAFNISKSFNGSTIPLTATPTTTELITDTITATAGEDVIVNVNFRLTGTSNSPTCTFGLYLDAVLVSNSTITTSIATGEAPINLAICPSWAITGLTAGSRVISVRGARTSGAYAANAIDIQMSIVQVG